MSLIMQKIDLEKIWTRFRIEKNYYFAKIRTYIFSYTLLLYYLL